MNILGTCALAPCLWRDWDLSFWTLPDCVEVLSLIRYWTYWWYGYTMFCIPRVPSGLKKVVAKCFGVLILVYWTTHTWFYVINIYRVKNVRGFLLKGNSDFNLKKLFCWIYYQVIRSKMKILLCLGGVDVAHLTAVRGLPGLIPSSGKDFYIYFFVLLLLFVF